ncbi:MAG: hypothetical protein P1P93_10475 [Gammaproteobacteria bacterium]|nr:hypothetical protein [Gammaproteobacteria bacterium]
MKRLLTAAALASTLLFSTQVLHADDHKPAQQRHSPEKMLDRMAERLNLTDEQKANIKPILEEEFEKMRAFREEKQQKIESFLTEDQKQQLQQRHEDRKNGCMGKYKHKNDDRD